MAEGESSLTVESSTEATVKSEVKPKPTWYSARVVIAVNRTGKKNDKGHEMYPKLPYSAVKAAKDLKVFFESLKMCVDYRENVDKKSIGELVSKVINESQDHEKILFYYIGHGEKGELLPHCTCHECRLPGIKYDPEFDGQPQKIVELIKKFHNDDTKHLRKLPVLFFFDCCQGKDRNEGVAVSMGPPDVQAREIVSYVGRIPDAGNILIAHSTLPMLKAYCDPHSGPNWTRVLLKNLKKDQSISDALHATQREVSKIDCSIKDPDGTVIMHRVQPSMFYSTLYCETINFCAMRDSLKTDSETAISSTRDSDSALPDDLDSDTIEGDDINNGSKPPQASKSAASQLESSPVQESDTDLSNSATVYPGLILKTVKRLKDLQEDIEKKIIIISQLKMEITQLKQEAKEKEEEYELELANKEKEINDLRVDFEAQLKEKEEELKMTRTKAQASELDNQRVKEESRKELDQLKKEHEEDIKRLEAHNLAEKFKLKYEHSEETKALEIKIRDQEIELERTKREVAEEKAECAKLKEQISKKAADEAIRERDAALKLKADEAEKKVDTTQQQIPSTSSTLAASTSASSEAVPSSITQGMENMNLKEAGGPDDDDESKH